jgi:glycosyltransferase involved in cell wall biosynthesis
MSSVDQIDQQVRKPTILWVGDSPTIPTGFAACTRAVCNHLHSQGWQVHVLGINEFGDPHPDIPYPIYPCWHPFEGGNDGMGAGRLPRLIEQIRPDVVVILSDPWQITGYLDYIKRYFQANASASHHWTGGKINGPSDPDEWVRYCADCGVEDLECGGEVPAGFPHCCQSTPIVGWLAVDGLNQVTAPRLNDLTRVVVWTKFAARELVKCGLEPARYRADETIFIDPSYPVDYPANIYGWKNPCVVPLGVDTSIFHPTDQTRARELLFGDLNLPLASFIVGYVGRNQPRKRLDLLLSYFAEWVATRNLTDAYLFLHVAPTKDMGADVQALAHYLGLDAVNGNGRLIVSEQPTHKGTSETDMPIVYAAMDVFLTTTQGEGMGLPELEAQACGVIVVAPDWSGLGTDGGWPAPGSIIRIPCTTTALTAPINSQCHTIGGIPDKAATLRALDQVYNDWKAGEGPTALVKLAGLQCARELTWKRSAQGMEKVLLEVLGGRQ